jgi:hypothetical protein
MSRYICFINPKHLISTNEESIIKQNSVCQNLSKENSACMFGYFMFGHKFSEGGRRETFHVACVRKIKIPVNNYIEASKFVCLHGTKKNSSVHIMSRCTCDFFFLVFLTFHIFSNNRFIYTRKSIAFLFIGSLL